MRSKKVDWAGPCSIRVFGPVKPPSPHFFAHGEANFPRNSISQYGTVDTLVKLGGFVGCCGEAAAQYDRGA